MTGPLAEPCPVPPRNYRERPLSHGEAVQVAAWYSREIRRRGAAARRLRPCWRCGEPGRPYLAGVLCEAHKPGGPS